MWIAFWGSLSRNTGCLYILLAEIKLPIGLSLAIPAFKVMSASGYNLNPRKTETYRGHHNHHPLKWYQLV